MRTLSIASLLLFALAAPAAPPPAAPPEFAQPQSPPKPEPFEVVRVDQGQFDPKLKGTSLPEGFKAEVVIDAPDTINPVGMTFDPDGNLYVMEWRPDAVTGDKWFEVKETFRYRDGTIKQVATMKKFTTDLVKFFKYDAKTGKFDEAADHHLRRTAVEHPLPRRLAVRDRARHRAAVEAGEGRAARGTCARRSRRASAASTTTRCPA